MLAVIDPLCDKDLASMSPKELPVESAGDFQIISAYVCNSRHCDRCYNEAAGYFDFIGGKPEIDTEQMLCKDDAHPMYLEFVTGLGEKIWRCPHCKEIVTY